MLVKDCGNNVIHVFINNGWGNWARFEIVRQQGRKYFRKHGGMRLPDDVMAQLKTEYLS
jgi:hypothetical protein